MFKWLWDWLDKLDGNVDGAVFGLGKAVAKLDKAILANERIAERSENKSFDLQLRAEEATVEAKRKRFEAERAARIKAKVEELLK